MGLNDWHNPKPSRAVVEERWKRKRRRHWRQNPCPTCLSVIWWRRHDRYGVAGRGAPVCAVCHPPGDPAIMAGVEAAKATASIPTVDPIVVVVGRYQEPDSEPKRSGDDGPNPFE